MDLYKCNDKAIFATELIQSFVMFKSQSSSFAFALYIIPYLAYIVCLILYLQTAKVLIPFFLWQSFELFGGVLLDSARIRPVWAVWDILRLTTMAVFIISEMVWPADTYYLVNCASILNFFSFITLVKYLRKIPGVREYITLIRVALEKMFYFFFIIMVFFIGFATSLRLKP